MRLNLASVGALVSLLLVTPVEAEQRTVDDIVTQALMAERDLEYDRAADLWYEVLSHPDVSEPQRVLANFRAGAVSRVLGKDVEARMHFVYVLEHAPDFAVPDETEPKIRNFFELVRQEVRSRHDKISREVEAQAGVTTPTPTPVEEPQPAAAAPPAAEQAPVEVAPTPPPATVAAQPTEPTESGEAPWLLVAGGGAAGLGLIVVATGGLVGWTAAQAHDAALATAVQLEREQHYDDRDRFGLIANICFGAGAVMVAAGAAAGGVALLTDSE